MNDIVELNESYLIFFIDYVKDALAADVRVLDLLECHILGIVNQHDDLNGSQVKLHELGYESRYLEAEYVH